MLDSGINVARKRENYTEIKHSQLSDYNSNASNSNVEIKKSSLSGFIQLITGKTVINVL